MLEILQSNRSHLSGVQSDRLHSGTGLLIFSQITDAKEVAIRVAKKAKRPRAARALFLSIMTSFFSNISY